MFEKRKKMSLIIAIGSLNAQRNAGRFERAKVDEIGRFECIQKERPKLKQSKANLIDIT